MAEPPSPTMDLASATMETGSVQGQSLVGRTLAGKYRLEKLLGEGGMGAVYRARQLALEKAVAVKVMHRELASDATFAARFHREAKAASRLDHQNSIRILDFGEEGDGLLYIAMEYLDGRDLLTIIEQESPLPAQRVVGILAQVLTALAVAHEMGVIHRDLKPENIMVLHGKGEGRGGDEDPDADVVKVCDFGIAKVNEAEVEEEVVPTRAKKGKLTTAGLVIGTPEYMSPEQGRGEPLDARSDLYSVGVILYYLLAGRTPFDAPTPLGIVVKHQSEDPIPPSTIRPEADPRLEAVCLKAMRKRPAERFGSAKEMRAALRAALEGAELAPISGNPHASVAHARTELQLKAVPSGVIVDPSATARAETAAAITAQVDIAARPSSRRWGLVAAISGAALLLGGGGAVVVYPMLTVANPPDPPRSSPVASPVPPAPSPSSARSAETASSSAAAPVAPTTLKEPRPSIQPATGQPKERTGSSTILHGEMQPSLPVNTAALPPPAPAAPPEAVVAPPPAAPLPAPPQTPSPSPIQAPPIQAPTAPAFDSKSAHITLGAPRVVGGSFDNPNPLKRAVQRAGADVERCFHQAPFSACWAGEATLHVEADGNGVVGKASLLQPPVAGLDGCLKAALPKIPQSDTGPSAIEIPVSCTPP